LKERASKVLKIETKSNTASLIGNMPTATTSQWKSGVLAGDGKIYGMPCGLVSFLVIDPATDTITTVPLSLPRNETGFCGWAGGVSVVPPGHSGGFIYAIPYTSPVVLKYNVGTGQYATFGWLGSGDKYQVAACIKRDLVLI
jgi:hypothetical protein